MLKRGLTLGAHSKLAQPKAMHSYTHHVVLGAHSILAQPKTNMDIGALSIAQSKALTHKLPYKIAICIKESPTTTHP